MLSEKGHRSLVLGAERSGGVEPQYTPFPELKAPPGFSDLLGRQDSPLVLLLRIPFQETAIAECPNSPPPF